jgi:hypothetical protein
VPAFKPNERDLAFLRLPRRLSFLYHIVKPVRLAREYSSNPSRFLRMIGNLMGILTATADAGDGDNIDLADCLAAKPLKYAPAILRIARGHLASCCERSGSNPVAPTVVTRTASGHTFHETN